MSQGSIERMRQTNGLNVAEYEKFIDYGFGFHIATNF